MSNSVGAGDLPKVDRGGVLAWMAGNSVAANLLMLLLLVGGLFMIPQTRQEVFPDAVPPIVNVTAVYPGASPTEVEEGVVLAIEQAVQGIEGVKRVTSASNEGVGRVTIELMTDVDENVATADIKNAVDAVTSFPVDVEQPTVSLLQSREETVSIIVYGQQPEATLRHWAYEIRDDLLLDPVITDVEVTEVRPLEVSIEVPQEHLREHGLTLPQVAAAVSAGSVDLPAGGLQTPGGEVLIRTTERRDTAEEFESLVMSANPDGSMLTLGDIGTVIDGFAETDQFATYNGLPAARVRVYRAGDQTPIELSDAVHAYLHDEAASLPEGIELVVWNDRSNVFRDRVQLLVKNAYYGLVLVLLLLGLFLDVRLAFWVTLGIPISFLGSILLMPTLDVSFNMISLFAFILTLGIVVDDAIVVGESIFHKQQQGYQGLDAAIAGVREVAKPVIFSVMTTIIAFVPMLFIPGVSGKFMRNVPLIVIAVFIFSLVESLLILPAHLAHQKSGADGKVGGLLGLVVAVQTRFSGAFDKLVASAYPPSARVFLSGRYATLAAGFCVLLMAVIVVRAGFVRFTFLPKVESDEITVDLRLPFGTPAETTGAWTAELVRAAEEVLENNGGAEDLSLGVYATVGRGASNSGSGSHTTYVSVQLVSIDQRPILRGDVGVTASQFAEEWRERIGDIPSAEFLSFAFSTGPSAGSAIDIQLSHSDNTTLEAAAERLAGSLQTIDGVIDIDSGVSPGKEQLNLTLRPEARTLGLTARDLALQVRAAFFGSEAARQQRGRDEVRVYVRLPRAERESEYVLETMMVRAPSGAELALSEAANIERSRSYTSIRRIDGRRVISVTADVSLRVTTANEAVAIINELHRDGLLDDTPGLRWSVGGEQEEQKNVVTALGRGMLIAIFCMYALMAVAFRSYAQPFIVLIAIPFGVVGAIAGHILMGYAVSMLSMFGIVALAGVVVNDTLLFVTAANTYRSEGLEPMDACIAAGTRRFRPILMTSLTTFLGLMPMLLETSVQARFLVPMAISLGFGVLFVTVIALVIAPAVYLIIEDASWLLTRVLGTAPTDDAPTELRSQSDGMG
ncbi:MAG: multidrug efflux pump subunit AcrB [Bradymonadia bacterium]|jgi:multidrug efflux pump subunit AcrB